MEVIRSSANAQVRSLLRLKKQAKERSLKGVFLVEGPKMVTELPRERIVQIWVSESFQALPAAKVLLEGRPYQILSDSVFDSLSDTRTPQGILAVVKRKDYTPQQLLGAGKEKALCVVLENLQDPGNLGTILRTAEGAGVTGILLSEGCVDMYNPKVVRSTMGSILRVPFCTTTDLTGTLKSWKEKGLKLYAAHLEGAVAFTRPDYTQPCAFLIGNESKGLTKATAALADARIRIPMKGRVESLNASVAASLLMYEALRQRG